MKAGWQVKTLGEVCEIVNGGTPKTGVKEYWGNEHLWITPAEMGKRLSPYANDTARKITSQGLRDSSARLLPPDSVILSSRAPIGHLVINTKLMATNQGCKGLVPSESLAYKYLFYFLQANVDLLNDLGSGATFKELSGSKLKEVAIPFPVRPEQQRIVAKLDQAFQGIAKARANAEQNLQNARALFESHLQSVFTERGEGWVKKKLGETSILKIIDGDRGINYPSKEEFSDDGFCLFLNTKNVRPDGFNFDTTMFISEKKDKVLRNGKLQRQDVILTTRGTIGNVAIFDANVEFENIRINSGMLIFRPNKEKLLSSFLFEVFRSSIMKDQMIRHVSGAAQPQLPIKTLIDFEIPVPDTLESQREIVASVREIDAETRRLGAIYQRKLTLLDELKKSLLQQAFAGEL